MPTKYTRKGPQKRRKWSQENLVEAINKIQVGEMGVNEAARVYQIPSRTLRRRRDSGVVLAGNFPLGPQGVLGLDNENRLVKHIQRLEKAGFAPDRHTLRSLAYQFAEKLLIKHRFNKDTHMAGYDWLSSFLTRHPELSVRKSQGLSLARSEGMNREEAKGFFRILAETYDEFDMVLSPRNIFNMDETGLQLNNEAGTVIATKGARDVHTIISSERGENVSIIACCSAEGTFLPPVLIFKGVREKKEFSDGLPTGSKVFMNPKSSYISTDLFYRWLREHFAPHKPPGRTILILDGHSSHCNALDMLDFADKNEITIICLPSHTTQALQPLDRSFFKPLKANFRKETRKWMINHPGRRITRLQAGQLIGNAWGKSASVEIGLSAFRATGIFPFNPDAVPDHFYAISDAPPLTESEINSMAVDQVSHTSETAEPVPGTSKEKQSVPGTSKETQSVAATSKETPSKYLTEISPVPVIARKQWKRKKQSAEVLTSSERITKIAKDKAKKVNKKNEGKKNKKLATLNTSDSDDVDSISSDEPLQSYVSKNKKKTRATKRLVTEETTATNSDDSSTCVECGDDYYQTKETVDWVQCTQCQGWFHETCTMYDSKCNNCGRIEKRAAVTQSKRRLNLN